MAGLAIDGSNPDVSLLYDINGLAGSAPGWFDRGMEFAGEYGIMIGLVLVTLWCWWSVRRRGRPRIPWPLSPGCCGHRSPPVSRC